MFKQCMKMWVFLWIGISTFTGCGGGSQNALQAEDKKENISQLSYADEGFAYLNLLRNFTGLIKFSKNLDLEAVAQNHARYQVSNNLYTHYERSSNLNFSGKTPLLRVLATDYPHTDIAENIYAGDVTPKHSINILFSNIYHRLAFLDFGFDEIGLGMHASQSYDFQKVYTYEMGRENSRSFNNIQNPKIVLWPYENQQNTMPVFYEESPDPLQKCSVSGYPISIQFNPSKNGVIKMKSFKLYDDAFKEITNTVLLDAKTDPNGLLSTKEFVLMPLSRLEWGNTYHVSAIYSENEGDNQIKEWDFTTKMLPSPYFVIEASDENFNLKSGETYHFYLPPKDCNDKFDTYTYRYTSSLKIDENIVDNNTIRVKAIGKGTIEINTDHGISFTLNIN